jgi:hypothetical protein
MARFRTPSIPLSADAQNVSEFYSRIYFGFRLWLGYGVLLYRLTPSYVPRHTEKEVCAQFSEAGYSASVRQQNVNIYRQRQQHF